jgi:hypothetical protein
LNKALTSKQIDHLLNFIGYGRVDADIWFFVMEESGGSEDGLRARLKFEELEDLPGMFQNHSVTTFLGARKGMCEIMLRLADRKADQAALQVYQSEYLGGRQGATLVCAINPLPKTESTEWSYPTLLPQYSSMQAFYEEHKTERLDLYRQLVDEHNPKMVLCIGKEHWDEYREIFNQLKFTEHDQFMMGWDTDTVVILTDEFESSEMEGKFGELVDIIRENALLIDTSFRSDTPVLSEAEIKRQKKGAARQAAIAKRKPSTTHDPADPYCVCAYCLRYEGVK